MRVYEKPPMFLASFLRFMAFRELLVPVQCPYCHSTAVIKVGKQANGTQCYQCHNGRCARRIFLLQYQDRGRMPEIRRQVVDLAMNGSGIRDTARVLRMSPTTVIAVLKKCMVCPYESTLYRSESSKRQPTAVMYPASVRDCLSPEP